MYVFEYYSEDVVDDGARGCLNHIIDIIIDKVKNDKEITREIKDDTEIGIITLHNEHIEKYHFDKFNEFVKTKCENLEVTKDGSMIKDMIVELKDGYNILLNLLFNYNTENESKLRWMFAIYEKPVECNNDWNVKFVKIV